MNFDLTAAASAARDRARACAREVVAPAAAGSDEGGRIPDGVQAALFAALPAQLADDGVAWVAAVEELAAVSAAAAVTAAGAALGFAAVAAPAARWTGLRGADADGLRALAADPRWNLAVTAVLVGVGRAALEQARVALRAARDAGAPRDAGQSSLADAATLLDGARLLLWEAAATAPDRTGAAAARGLARMQALDAAAQAMAAVTQATDADAARVGTPLERLTRDWSTVARVFGDADGAQRDVAAAHLPA